MREEVRERVQNEAAEERLRKKRGGESKAKMVRGEGRGEERERRKRGERRCVYMWEGGREGEREGEVERERVKEAENKEYKTRVALPSSRPGRTGEELKGKQRQRERRQGGTEILSLPFRGDGRKAETERGR